MEQLAGAASRSLISAQVQVVLVVAGLVCLVIAILGSGDYVKVVIPTLKPWARILLASMGAAVFALAFVPGIISSSPGATNPGPLTPSHTAAPNPVSAGPIVTLTSPTHGQSVSRSKGFAASGEALSLGSGTVWILDYDGGYTVDQEGTVASGLWSAVDQPLGDSSDSLPYYLTMRVVIANPACAAILQKTNETTQDYLTQLPAGCKYVTGVTVHVTTP